MTAKIIVAMSMQVVIVTIPARQFPVKPFPDTVMTEGGIIVIKKIPPQVISVGDL